PIRRIHATLPDTDYYYDVTGNVLEERSAVMPAQLYWRYIWGDQSLRDLIARVDTYNVPQFVLTDAHGSVISRVSNAGTALTRLSYDAYGNPTQLSADWSTIQVISEDGYLFHGQKWSMEQGQYLSAEGFWDPEIGRGLVPANGSNADAEETAETLGNGYIFAAY